ncbi:hypothetical protein [Streptomyces sp. NBC_01465]|uniref:hypothetical protein n=1 Tax=Streptomyces sp. NBC_01465 TaxID=2903878 RepID=UPI002E37AFA1|nr:hypothetical protein [Streptomyces sp. NBC_01465]
MNATTKTETTDETAAEAQAAKAQAAEAEEAAAEAVADDEDDDADLDALLAAEEAEEAASSTGIKSGAAAVVAAALGFLSLSGTWLGTVEGARETLNGQVNLTSTASTAAQIKEGYVDGWHATAAVGGIFALLALIVGVVVIAVVPAFGTPGRKQPNWIKSVAWGGIALGVVGLLVAIATYTGFFAGTPVVPSA